MNLPPVGDAASRYIELLKGCLTRELFIDEELTEVSGWPRTVAIGKPREVWAELDRMGWKIVKPTSRQVARLRGKDIPPHAETMIGRKRMDNLHELVEAVLDEGVPGDLVETGVWRGGASILMRAILVAHGAVDRRVWVCDSFRGLPEPDVGQFPVDASLKLDPDAKRERSMKTVLAVSLDQVKANFEHYGLLDEGVCFLEGWFRDTLPDAPIDQIAVLRVDGDLYESTRDALVHLEPKVSAGGYVIIDDYNGLEACRQAVDEYRSEQGIVDQIHDVDWTGVWWKKSAR
jgi:O-methyltransferase